ncbi:MAG: hypothetical protein WA667_12950, partial [Candidatus Nitrosopolaris sp.]
MDYTSISKHRQKDDLFQVAEDVMTEILHVIRNGMKLLPAQLQDQIIEAAEIITPSLCLLPVVRTSSSITKRKSNFPSTTTKEI